MGLAQEVLENGGELAVPAIASPGAMLACVLLTENSRFNIWEQAQTVSMMLAVVLFVNLLLLLMSSSIHRIIGNAGASVISGVMGLILSSVAVTNTLAGISSYFQLNLN